MIAVVFAAGIGSRLKPFTDLHPKALAPLGGVPLLGRVLHKLAEAGARAAVINVHHFPQQIREYLASEDFGLDIEISDESGLLLDTAGGLAKMVRDSRVLGTCTPAEDIVVHNADIYTDFCIADMLSAHHTSGADATLLADSRRQSTRAFLFDNEGRLHGWRNSATGAVRPKDIDTAGLTAAPFGGVHVLRRDLLDAVSDFVGPELHPCSIVDFYLSTCGGRDYRGYTPTAPYRWHDIGTPEKLEAAQALFSE